MTAGQQLRAQFAEALARASRECGRALEWTEAEVVALDLAAECADRADVVRALLDRELARPEPRATNVTKLSAEVRLLNKAKMDYLWRLNPGPGVAKSERHQRAGRMRWEAHKTPSRGA
ncbi:hypothetical protein [Mycobacterium sp. 852002-53434_SCH5985345]|uniref:hypothetical protein n=1 Tax=Mycobacterium sp. 852002-53434_SCH5985345 TaxID=1834107 RepID=UPI0012E70C75|nr:hypothetical protein [Mycobacterium sp. 852002-53434_SCH5985345]